MDPSDPARPSWEARPVVHGRPSAGAVRDLFAWLAPEYDAAVNGYSLGQDLRWKSELVTRLKPRRGERALDLATGTGRIQERLVRVLGPDQVIGLDASRSMLGARPTSGRRLLRANAEHLPFADATFDLVTAGYLLKYVDLRRLLEEVARVLRPGGRFGAYDFSRPRRETAEGRLYGIYLHRLLPGAGAVLGRGDAGWPAMMRFLGRLAEESRWEERIAPELERAGYTGIELVGSLGGAVTWVWAARPAGRPV